MTDPHLLAAVEKLIAKCEKWELASDEAGESCMKTGPKTKGEWIRVSDLAAVLRDLQEPEGPK